MRLPPAPLRRSGCGEPSGTAVAASRQGDRCLLPDQPLCTPHGDPTHLRGPRRPPLALHPAGAQELFAGRLGQWHTRPRPE